jgi:hypothetical protein
MVNDVDSKNDPRYLPETQAFSTCTICDIEYPAGTENCPKCQSPLSSVRRCPSCQRIVSSRHETCIYCACSLLAIHAQPRPAEPLVAIPRGERKLSKPDQMKAIGVALAVFLIIVLVGVTRLFHSNSSSTASSVKATSFAIRNSTLHIEPSESSGTARTVPNGTILRLSRLVRDNTGRPWFLVLDDGKETAISLNDVAPPKVSDQEEGAKMLHAYLIAFDHPDLAQDAAQAVNYYCSEFPSSSHCEELRWVAAEKLRSMAQHSSKRTELLSQTRELYKTLIDQNGPHASEAKKSLGTLAEPAPARGERSNSPAPKAAKGSKSNFRQYALVDAAEVQLRIPDLSKLSPGEEIRTPIAREIRVNGQMVVPANAICILQIVSGSTEQSKIARLSAIEFGGRRYAVSTEPKLLERPGSIVKFPLDSSLLIGH